MGGDHRIDYVVDVPEGSRTSSPWQARRGEQWPADAQLMFGSAPLVTLTDFDVRPGVERTRIVLTAPDERDADMRELSFPVDRRFAEMLRPGDRIHMGCGTQGGFGISVLRGGRLVAAAGGVSNVELGDEIAVRYPGNVVRDAQAFFRAIDPEYRMGTCPVEITVGDETRLMDWGRPTFGDLEVFIVHPFIQHRECVAITRRGVCPDCAATLTACAFKAPGAFEVRPFRTAREWSDQRLRESLDAAWRHLNLGEIDAAYDNVLIASVHDRENVEVQALLAIIETRRDAF